MNRVPNLTMRRFHTPSPRPGEHSFLCFLFCSIALAGYTHAIRAQQYHWRRAYLPFNNQDSWASIAFNPLSKGRVVFAGPDFPGGIFRSDDGGTTWVEHDSLLDPKGTGIGFIHQIFVVPSDTNVVLAIGANGFYRSTNGGLTWNDLFNHDTLGGSSLNTFGGIGAECLDYNFQEDALYYGADNYNQRGAWNEVLAGVWRSTDRGANWALIAPDTINDSTVNDSIQQYSLDVSQDSPPELIQSTVLTGSLLAYSSDLGEHWSITFAGSDGVETPKIVFSWHQVSPTTGKHDIAVVQRWPATDSSLVATTDGGRSWQILNSPARLWGLDIDQRASMLSRPGDPAYPLPLHYFTGFFDVDQDSIPNGLIQETTDGGISWHSTNFPRGAAGESDNPKVRNIWVIKYDTSTGRLAVATDSGIYIGDWMSGVTPPSASQIAMTLSRMGSLVSLSSPEPIEWIHLFDITGRELFAAAPRNSDFRIDLSGYPPGVYDLEAIANGQPPFRKLVAW